MPKGSVDLLRVEVASGEGWVELAVCADWFMLDPEERDLIFAIADRMRDWAEDEPDEAEETPTVEREPIIPPEGPRPEETAALRSAAAAAAKRPRYDRAEVARIATEAHAQGRRMSPAVADALGVTEGRARQLISEARTDGFQIPSMPRGRPPRRPVAPNPPTALEVLRDEKPPREHRCMFVGCDEVFPNEPQMTGHLISAHGLKGPSASQVRSINGPAIVLKCDDCQGHFDNLATLGAHTRVHHGRPPRPDERTPIEEADAS